MYKYYEKKNYNNYVKFHINIIPIRLHYITVTAQ